MDRTYEDGIRKAIAITEAKKDWLHALNADVRAFESLINDLEKELNS